MFTLKAGRYPGFGNGGGVKIEDFFYLGGRKLVTQLTRMFIATLYIDIAKTKYPFLHHLMYYLFKVELLKYFLGLNKYRKSYKIQLGITLSKIWCLGVKMTP